jgi:thiol:disulfide interchange protein
MWLKMRRTILIAVAAFVLVGSAGRLEVAAQGKRSDSVVKTTITADKIGADGKQVITISMSVDKDWHIYANPVGAEMLATSQTKVTVADKKAEDVQIEFPKGKERNDSLIGKYNIYEGEVAIKATVVRGKDDKPLKVKVKFMACNDKGNCLLPATVEETVP